MEKISKQRDRQIKMAIAMKNAKLKQALMRKAAAQANAMMQKIGSERDSTKNPDQEKNEIYSSVEKGDSVEDAVYKTLLKRHKKERKDLIRDQQDRSTMSQIVFPFFPKMGKIIEL